MMNPFIEDLLARSGGPIGLNEKAELIGFAFINAFIFGKQPPAADEGPAAPYAAAVRAAVAALDAKAKDDYETSLARQAIVPLYLAYLQATIVDDLPKRNSFGLLALGMLGLPAPASHADKLEPIQHI